MQESLTVSRKFNFSAGPAVIPVPVLEKVQSELLALNGVGSSILEISHRSPAFDDIMNNCRQRLTKLFNIPDTHEILFLQGGSNLQFSMIPMNISIAGNPSSYIVSGSWSKKAFAEANRLSDSTCIWDGAEKNYSTLPAENEVNFADDTPYLYLVSNETIQGVQFPQLPQTDKVQLVVDASSDFMSQPINWDNVGIYYACAQKNAGVAGLTTVIVRRSLLERAPDNLPGYLTYQNHLDNDSRFNTPPVFGIYVLDLICQWVEEQFGNLETLQSHNKNKAKLLYDVVDNSEFYIGHADPTCRSDMNVTFKLANPDLDGKFKEFAGESDLVSLGGHRSVGGFRASIYNAMPVEGVELLANVMRDFEAKH